MTIRRFIGRNGLLEIEPMWRTLLHTMEGSRRYFHYPELYSAYLNVLEKHPDNVSFYVAFDHDEPLAILPLQTTTSSVCGISSRILEIPHNKHMSLTDGVVAPRNSGIFASIVKHLQATDHTWDTLLLPNLLPNSELLKPLSALPRCVSREKGWSDSLRFASHDEFLSAVSKNFRGNLRKARNKLNKIADARFESCTELLHLPAAFDSFLSVEASGWKGARGSRTAIQSDPRLLAFYRELMAGFGASGRCLINRLLVAETCVAAQFCIRGDKVIHVLKIGYSEEHSPIAPGNMLLEWLIQRATQPETGINEIDLITGVQWHDDWRPHRVPVADVLIFNRTARGAAFHGMCSLKSNLRKISTRFRAIGNSGRNSPS